MNAKHRDDQIELKDLLRFLNQIDSVSPAGRIICSVITLLVSLSITKHSLMKIYGHA